jgi:hypothetical protein
MIPTVSAVQKPTHQAAADASSADDLSRFLYLGNNQPNPMSHPCEDILV